MIIKLHRILGITLVLFVIVLSITGTLLQHADDIHIYIAWIYAGLRILHSIVQMTTNYIPLRAGLFICSGMCLIAMIVREGLFLLG